MKEIQPKLTVGTEGKVLIDSTNVHLKHITSLRSRELVNSKKRKSENLENIQPSKCMRKDGIYTDPSVPLAPMKEKKFVDASVQTDHDESPDESIGKAQRIKDMLTCESAPAHYWESLAERRRVALEVSLEENRSLTKENEELKEENKILEEMVQDAKHLASLVQEITNSEDPSTNHNGTSTSEEEDQT